MTNKMQRARRKHTDLLVETAIKMYSSGKTVAQTAFATGISSSYIKNLLEERQVPRRPSGFQQGNKIGLGREVTASQRASISAKHRTNGHQPTREAIDKGQPKTLVARWGKHDRDPAGQLFKRYKKDAERLGRTFELTRSEFDKLISSECYYCGDPPTERVINHCFRACYNGVDRVNSLTGYTNANCVAACKICNIMKKNYTKEFFLDHCRKISTFHGGYHA